jgi:two-component system chemotaxis sensor kinase CheA
VDSHASIKHTYFQECEERLTELEAGLAAMKDGDRDAETVNSLFRAVHSIKGGAGAFGLDQLVDFAHIFETTLEEMRAGRLAPGSELIEVMLRASDMLSDHVSAARDGNSLDLARSQAIAAELEMYAGDAGNGDEAELDFDFQPIVVALADGAAGSVVKTTRWIVECRPKASLYASANEIAFLLRELQRLGTAEIDLDKVALPPLDKLDPDEAYLGWTVRLATERSRADIAEIFEFVDGHCEVDIRPEADADGGVADCAAVPPEAVQPAAPAAPTPVDVPADGAPGRPATDQVQPNLASEPASEGKFVAATAQSPTIRVDLDRVERLVNLVGELVINQAMLTQRVAECGLARSTSVAAALDDLEHLTREIQDSVMAIRAQPVKSVFQRMARLVREVSAATGKRVRLITDGEETEVDKTVIERIADPLTHMVRNAIDHGLETPEGRLAAGKPEEGVVRLSALHRGGRIVIEVSDDGAGIDRKRVKAAAVKKGLIAADAPMSDEEIDNLIFVPGFSTASAVSDISGRGVGMDVVRREIQSLGGRISISSRAGAGSTFSLSLPLTLAVLDGMVVSVCGQTLVCPLSTVVETLQPKASNLQDLDGNVRLLRLRDLYVPIVDVGCRLGFRSEPLDPTVGVSLFVESERGSRAALLVDAIQGQRQVVIKSMETNYRKVNGIAAATILGDGRVALILDIDSLLGQQRGEQVRPVLRAAS